MQLPSPGEPAYAPEKFLFSTRNETSAQYSPDGSKVAFRSDRTGNDEIWICERSGANAFALTSFRGVLTGSPRWSPDGQYLAFDSRPAGNAEIYVIAAAGGTPRRITTETSEEVVPSWSKDGNWIYFASNRTGAWQVWKAPAQQGSGGKALQVTRQGGFAAFESADGKWVFYSKGPDRPGLWRVAVEGGEESEIVPELKAGYWGYWAPGETGIYFIDLRPSSTAVVKLFSFTRRHVEQLATLDKDPPFGDAGFSVSRDGRWILYTQVDESGSDIMLVENFQ
jgi:Tol biopolymer transport system component